MILAAFQKAPGREDWGVGDERKRAGLGGVYWRCWCSSCFSEHAWGGEHCLLRHFYESQKKANTITMNIHEPPSLSARMSSCS